VDWIWYPRWYTATRQALLTPKVAVPHTVKSQFFRSASFSLQGWVKKVDEEKKILQSRLLTHVRFSSAIHGNWHNNDINVFSWDDNAIPKRCLSTWTSWMRCVLHMNPAWRGPVPPSRLTHVINASLLRVCTLKGSFTLKPRAQNVINHPTCLKHDALQVFHDANSKTTTSLNLI